jgi:hypothetical protein
LRRTCKTTDAKADENYDRFNEYPPKQYEKQGIGDECNGGFAQKIVQKKRMN